MPNMMWGDLAHYNLNVGEEMVATGHVARILEKENSVLSTD
jgi:tRNA U34 2-thiouridine synthase MnmA/TrmU